MATIRAKFKVQSVETFENCEIVKLNAANGKHHTANGQWSNWTPAGQLCMTISNPDSQGKMKPGAYFFLDFTETTEEAP